MQSKLLHKENLKVYALVFDKGEEFMQALTEFADQHRLDSSHFTALGAFERAKLAYFDRKTMGYSEIPIQEQVEVLSLVGDIAIEPDGDVKVHAHAVLGRADGTAVGGHVLEAYVWPTLELVVQETPSYLRRRHDKETGLALLAL